MEQKLVNNPKRWDADQLAYHKAWRSSILDYRTQIHPVVGSEDLNWDLWITRPGP